MYERFLIPKGIMDKKYLENLEIECKIDNTRATRKVPDINLLECGKKDSKFAVFFVDQNKKCIIYESDDQNKADLMYTKTVNAIITAYNNRKDQEKTYLWTITLSDIEKTLFDTPPLRR